MDASSLLYGYRPAKPEDLHRKALALRSGFEISRSRGYAGSLKEFLDAAGTVATHCFGNDGHDSYATTALSVVGAFQPGLDMFLAAVLNGIVVQMNFQSRQIIEGVGGPPEVVVFEGQDGYFPVAMMHGNVTGGINISSDGTPFKIPDWAVDNPTLEIASGHVLSSHFDNIEHDIVNLGRNRIGAFLVLPDTISGPVNIAQRFTSIARFATQHTIYCFAGGAEMVLAAADELNNKYPDISLDVRLYDVLIGGAVEYRAIAIASGLSYLPDITINPIIERASRFVEAMSQDGKIEGVQIMNYFDRTGVDDGRSADGRLVEVGSWDAAPMRRPFSLSASAPLPDEARGRISDATEIFHSLVILDRGILAPSQDDNHAIYVHATGNAEIIMDYGDEGRNVLSSPIYLESHLNELGDRIGALRAKRLLRVEGAAMPLMFTPLLHKWYSHFIIQCLPRVRIARELNRDVKLLIPADLRTKQTEMLKILGFGEDRLVRMEPGCFVQADELIVPRAWRLAFTPYSAVIYDEIAAHFDRSTKDTPRRILISRESRKTWRNMLNYEAVRIMLVSDYGFEVVAPEHLTLEEEVAIYANAEIVVGAEGAGMYGAVFSRPGSIYLTLCDEDYVMPILGTLAHIRNIDIGYVFGESMRADSDIPRRLPYGHADFVVDIDRVEQAVQSAIARADAIAAR